MAGQIHDAGDVVSTFRLEGTNLYVTEGNNSHHKLVTDEPGPVWVTAAIPASVGGESV